MEFIYLFISCSLSVKKISNRSQRTKQTYEKLLEMENEEELMPNVLCDALDHSEISYNTDIYSYYNGKNSWIWIN